MSASQRSVECGGNLGSNPTVRVATWPVDDPDFEEKAADVIGLYLKPPVHAAVFCVDEKSAIQALDRLDPVLPAFSRPGRTAWLRVLPPRNAFTLQRFEHSDWRGTG